MQLHINRLIYRCFRDLSLREADHVRVTDNVPKGNFDWTMFQFVKGLQERGVCSSKWCLFNKKNNYDVDYSICYMFDSHFPTINGLTETVVHCYRYVLGLDNNIEHAAKVTPSPQPGLGAFKGNLGDPVAKIGAGQVAGNSNLRLGDTPRAQMASPLRY